MVLTEQQKAEIERKRLAALEILRQKQLQKNLSSSNVGPVTAASFSSSSTFPSRSVSNPGAGQFIPVNRPQAPAGNNPPFLTHNFAQERPHSTSVPGTRPLINGNAATINGTPRAPFTNGSTAIRPNISVSVPPVVRPPNSTIRPPNIPVTTSTGAPQNAQPAPAPIQKVVVKAVIVDARRFQIRAGYSEKLISHIKTFKSKEYDYGTRTWSLDFSDYLTFDQSVRTTLREYVTWEGFPRCVVDVFARGFHLVSRKPDPDDMDEKIPASLMKSLLPYQVAGVRFAIKNGGRVLIADDMGLGKSVQAIAIAAYYRPESWPVLCVCPSSMRYVWKDQWKKWLKLSDSDISVINSSSQTDGLVGVKVAIITYELLSKMKSRCSGAFRFTIFDESHTLKSSKTQQTKAAMDIAQHAQRVILLSGTPALSRPLEIYSQIEMVNKDIFKRFTEFGVRYCNGHQTHLGHWDYTGVSNAQELKLILENTVVIRRMKDDVGNQLPSKRREMILLDPADVKSKMTELKSAAEQYFKTKENQFASAAELRSNLFVYYQQTGKAKLPAVIRYVKKQMVAEPSLKAVVFARHLEVIQGLYDALKEFGAICISGSVAPGKRKEDVDKFQKDPSCRVAVLSVESCSTGITMTAASTVFFAELYWNPGILAQAEDRLHRIGQENNVTVKYLIAKDTADDDMWKLLQTKLDFLNKSGLSKDSLNMSTTHQSQPALPFGASQSESGEEAVEALFEQLAVEMDQESRGEKRGIEQLLDEHRLPDDDPDDALFAELEF